MPLLGLMFDIGQNDTFNAARDIPSLEGKVALVTGATSGIGKQCVLDLARHGPARIFLAARNPSKAEATIAEIHAQVPGANLSALPLDLASFSSVRDGARLFTQQSDRLDLLIINGGVMMAPAGLTEDRYEVHLGINHLGHALLTKLLLPTLVHTAERPGADVRVVVTSSESLRFAGPEGVDYAHAKTPDGGIYWSFFRYGQSKMANTLWAAELARRYPCLTVAAAHPGGVKTGLADQLARDSLFIRWFLMPFADSLVRSPEAGARNPLWCAVSDDVKSGEFYLPVGRLGHAAPGADRARDPDLARRLWEWTEEQLDGWKL